VVTSLVFRTVPTPDVTNVHLSWPFSDAAAVIGGWQAWAPFGPDELAARLKVTAAAEVDRPLAVDVYAAVRGSEAMRRRWPTSSPPGGSGPHRRCASDVVWGDTPVLGPGR
jgi:hypothetical protein